MSRVKALNLGCALAVLVSIVLFAEGQWTQGALGREKDDKRCLALFGVKEMVLTGLPACLQIPGVWDLVITRLIP